MQANAISIAHTISNGERIQNHIGLGFQPQLEAPECGSERIEVQLVTAAQGAACDFLDFRFRNGRLRIILRNPVDERAKITEQGMFHVGSIPYVF